MQYVSPWNRFLSACSDITIVRLMLDLISLTIPPQWLIHKSIVFSSFAACIILTYFLPRIIFKGQTLGMWFYGYRVVKSIKAKRLTWFEEILRFISQWISALLFFLPFTYVFFNKKSAHFSDLVVDSVPEKTQGRFDDAWPFQKFLGLLLIVMAINGIFASVQKMPAIDMFGRIIKGELARGIHISLILFCGFAGFLNLSGKRRAAHAAAILYLILLLSAAWSLAKFDGYQRRVAQNLRETLVSANSQSQEAISEKMLNGILHESNKYLQGNLKNATRANLAINALCFFYMLYLVFLRQLQPYRDKLFAHVAQRADRIYYIVKSKKREKGSEKT